MQKILHTVDWYTKMVLTLIAIALLVIAVRPVFTLKKASALSEAQPQPLQVDLNIDKVGGEKILRWWEGERAEKGIPIYIDGKIKTEE